MVPISFSVSEHQQYIYSLCLICAPCQAYTWAVPSTWDTLQPARYLSFTWLTHFLLPWPHFLAETLVWSLSSSVSPAACSLKAYDFLYIVWAQCVFTMCVWMCVQSCLTLCDPMNYSPPGFSVHGFFQARILEWVAISSTRDQTHISVSCIGRCILYHWATWEVLLTLLMQAFLYLCLLFDFHFT